MLGSEMGFPMFIIVFLLKIFALFLVWKLVVYIGKRVDISKWLPKIALIVGGAIYAWLTITGIIEMNGDLIFISFIVPCFLATMYIVTK